MVFRTIVFLFFTSFLTYSQTTINGKITNQNNIALQGATVVVTRIKEETILAYAISDSNGEYSLDITSLSDSLLVKTSFVGYSKQLKVVVNKNQEFNFTLSESSEQLKEIIIKNNPIIKKGDTISYSVSVFKEQKDRVIADVLKKMPGIEVLTDGKILYQGKPIQKYYIEGLDLLEGQYNLANNNLPISSVSKVQILENHQPIKLLDSLVFSDKASLNIKLKKNITVTGTSKIGIGATPFLWDVNITPMFFSKKQQMISSYQSNNSGNDISTQIKNLTLEELFEKFDYDNEKRNWATINELPNPFFSKNRWLNNNAHLITNNYLMRLKKDIDFKINLSYINDLQTQIGNSKTSFLTPARNTVFNEKINNKLYFNSLKSKFVLIKNTAKNYFKNTFEIEKFWDFQVGLINFNNQDLHQKAKIPYTSFSNKLKIIQPVGKKMITFNSVLSYSNSIQNLSFNQSQFENLLNENMPFDKLDQEIKHSNFYTNNSFSYTKGFKNITFITKNGFSIHNQKLNSRIFVIDDTPKKIFPNNLNFNKSIFYTDLNIQYQINDWKIELEAPLKLQMLDRNDYKLREKEGLNRLTFEPQLYIKKQINHFWKTTLSMKIKNTFGDIEQLYFGYILNNYRNIQRYENPILENYTITPLIGLSYRNPLKSFFFNSFYSYANSNYNLISGNNIDADGTTSFGLFEKNNTRNKHNINLSVSKFFSKLKTTVSLGLNGTINDQRQLVNTMITDVKSKNIELKAKADIELTEWFSIENQNKISFSDVQFNNDEPLSSIVSQEHSLNLNFYLTQSKYIELDMEYYKNIFLGQSQENYFLNLIYGNSFNKSKIDFEISLNNILNTKQFISLFSNNFSYIRSIYNLRPRQLKASIKFNL